MIDAPCSDKLKVEQLRIPSWQGKVHSPVGKPEKETVIFKRMTHLKTKQQQKETKKSE